MDITLVAPTIELEKQVLLFRQKMLAEDSVINGGTGLEDYTEYSLWLDFVTRMYHRETVVKGYVEASTFLGMSPTEEVAGIVNIRHFLNDDLRIYGGHIGYSVSPDYRRQGVATQLLQGGLDFLKKRGVPQALITCNEDNIGSKKTILRCGGVLESEVVVHGYICHRYWIPLSSPKVEQL